MVKGWEIGEYQGIGALEVPVYPVRTIIVAAAALVVPIHLALLARALRSAGPDAAEGLRGP